MSTYRRRVYRLPEGAEEALTALLWASGTAGTHSIPEPGGLLRLEAYFPEAPPDGSGPETGLPLALPAGVELVAEGPLEDKDWLEAHRLHAQPIAVGQRLLLDPREPEAAPPDLGGRTLLRLPARQAFGTGSHESTRLILQLMEETDLEGKRVLDVGTGSGVLCFAALVFGASKAVGLELDLPSALLAGQNSSLNGLFPSFVAGRLDAFTGEPPSQAAFDAALVNVLPERILPDFPLLPPLLRPQADLLLSGILVEREQEILDHLGPWGFRLEARVTEGEWVAFRCRR